MAATPEERLTKAASRPWDNGDDIASIMARSRNDLWMVPLVSRVVTGMPTREKRVVAAYALRFIGPMRFRRQLGNDIALDRLQSFADGCKPGDLELVRTQPSPRKNSNPNRKRATSGAKTAKTAKKRYMRSLDRPVSGGAFGLGRRR